MYVASRHIRFVGHHLISSHLHFHFLPSAVVSFITTSAAFVGCIHFPSFHSGQFTVKNSLFVEAIELTEIGTDGCPKISSSFVGQELATLFVVSIKMWSWLATVMLNKAPVPTMTAPSVMSDFSFKFVCILGGRYAQQRVWSLAFLAAVYFLRGGLGLRAGVHPRRQTWFAVRRIFLVLPCCASTTHNLHVHIFYSSYFYLYVVNRYA